MAATAKQAATARLANALVLLAAFDAQLRNLQEQIDQIQDRMAAGAKGNQQALLTNTGDLLAGTKRDQNQLRFRLAGIVAQLAKQARTPSYEGAIVLMETNGQPHLVFDGTTSLAFYSDPSLTTQFRNSLPAGDRRTIVSLTDRHWNLLLIALPNLIGPLG